MKFKYYFVCFFMLSIVVNSHADEKNTDIVADIFQLSGLSSQLEYLPDTIEMGVLTALQNLKKTNKISSKTVQRYIDVVRQSFVVENLSQAILIYLDKHFNRYNSQIILRWLNSKLGKQITYLEKRSSQPEQIDAMLEFVRNLPNAPPSKARLALVAKLNVATQASKSTLIVLMTEKLAIELIKSQFLSRENRPALLTVMKRIARQQFIIEDEITALVIDGLLFTYQTVSDADLQKYIDYANSESGKRYHQAILGAYNSALLDASSEFGRTIYRQ